MRLNEYQNQAVQFNVAAGSKLKNEILMLGLVGEAGEVADKWKKVLAYRDGQFTSDDVAEIGKELGDTLWYIAVLAESLGMSLEKIAQQNLDKLGSRRDRNVVRGAGDNR